MKKHIFFSLVTLALGYCLGSFKKTSFDHLRNSAPVIAEEDAQLSGLSDVVEQPALSQQLLSCNKLYDQLSLDALLKLLSDKSPHPLSRLGQTIALNRIKELLPTFSDDDLWKAFKANPILAYEFNDSMSDSQRHVLEKYVYRDLSKCKDFNKCGDYFSLIIGPHPVSVTFMSDVLHLDNLSPQMKAGFFSTAVHNSIEHSNNFQEIADAIQTDFKGAEAKNYLEGALRELSEVDPHAAYNQYQEYLQKNVLDDNKYSSINYEILSSLTNKDPDDAIDFINRNQLKNPGAEARELVQGFGSALAETNPNEALQYISQLNSPALQQQSAMDAYDYLSINAPQKNTDAFLQTLSANPALLNYVLQKKAENDRYLAGQKSSPAE